MIATLPFTEKRNTLFSDFADFRKTKISRFEAEKLAITVDHESILEIWKFILSSIEKIKPSFLLFTVYLFPESNGIKS